MLDERRWLAIVAIGLSIFLSALDASIVALALPEMARQFQLSESLTSAAILGYTLPNAILILPCGVLVARFRALPLFLVAVLGFGIGSCICGLAPTFVLLLLGRVIQGCFGALIATQGLAVAAAVVAPNERGRAMGIIGSLAPLGAIAGPGIGGQILAHWHWSVIFFVNVPLCLLAALLGLLSLRRVNLSARQHGASGGWRHMTMLLGRASFRWGLLGFLCSVTIAGALYYLLPFDLGDVQRVMPATAGLVLLCMPLGMGCVGLLGGYLTDRYGARPFTLAGAGLMLLGLVLLAFVLAHPTSVFDLIWRLLLIGAGVGLFNGPNQTLLMSAGPRETMGAASALSNLSARMGSVIGPLLLSIAWSLLPGQALHMNGGGIILIVLAVLCVLCAWLVRQNPEGATAQYDASLQAHQFR